MYKYHLSLGSNIEPRLDHLKQAVHYLEAYGQVVLKSGIFETAPWGVTRQAEFYNANIRYHTAYPPAKLLEHIKRIERKMGRIPGSRWGPRIIDIDIIWCDLIRIDEKELAVPHPHLPERRFVLEPLGDVTEQLYMSDGTTRVSELLLSCTDRSRVKKTEITW